MTEPPKRPGSPILAARTVHCYLSCVLCRWNGILKSVHEKDALVAALRERCPRPILFLFFNPYRYPGQRHVSRGHCENRSEG